MINLQMLIALGGGLLAAAQALLIVFEGNILCLNDGCEIVETLTTVPPIAFNVAGGLFFMTVFLALWQGAKGAKGWLELARVLLLAGMAAEGVLIGFQYWVAEVFCSYCLIVFSIIVVLNLLMGSRQILAASVVFCAVLVGFASLQFVPHSEAAGQDLENGVYGRLDKGESGEKLYLFFSSTCPHCEDVIATLDESFDCSLNFNPLDELKHPPLENLSVRPAYSPEVNRRYLKNVGISEIPVLVVKTAEEIRILKGKQAIQEHLNGACRAKGPAGQISTENPGVGAPDSLLPFVSPAPGGAEDACPVEEECETVPSGKNGK